MPHALAAGRANLYPQMAYADANNNAYVVTCSSRDYRDRNAGRRSLSVAHSSCDPRAGRARCSRCRKLLVSRFGILYNRLLRLSGLSLRTRAFISCHGYRCSLEDGSIGDVPKSKSQGLSAEQIESARRTCAWCSMPSSNTSSNFKTRSSVH